MDSILFIRSTSSNRPSYTGRLNGAMDAARRRGWRIQTVDKPSHDKIPALLNLWHPLGVIIESGSGANHFPASLFHSLPTVYLDTDRRSLLHTDGRIGCVEHDPVAVTRLAAKELLSADCVSYAFIPNFVSIPWSQDRADAFAEILKLHNKTPFYFSCRRKKEDLVHWHQDLRQFLSLLPKPCGIFAANDPVGESVLVACADIGLSIPDDALVVGVDNAALICENTLPTLSSVALDFTGAGRMSVELLEELMKTRSNGLQIRTFGALGLTRRGSSCKLLQRDPGVSRALEMIRTKSCDGVTLEQILSVMNCSRRQAELRFRAATGHSPLEEIQKYRLERACGLLTSTNRSIDAIANMCGYGSPVFLQKLFRRHLKTTPTQYRRQHLAVKPEPS